MGLSPLWMSQPGWDSHGILAGCVSLMSPRLQALQSTDPPPCSAAGLRAQAFFQPQICEVLPYRGQGRVMTVLLGREKASVGLMLVGLIWPLWKKRHGTVAWEDVDRVG